MSAQPLNTTIQVFQRVRSQRQDLRHETVEALTKRLRPLITIVPGHETLTAVLAADATTKDFSSYGRNGVPIVRGLKKVTSFAQTQENTAGVDFAFQIGRDKFVQNTSDQLARDLYADAQASANTPN
jgi:hypothetical protein